MEQLENSLGKYLANQVDLHYLPKKGLAFLCGSNLALRVASRGICRVFDIDVRGEVISERCYL